MTKTYSWDYDQNIVTEWLRQGCNHCGECCLVSINIPTADSIGRNCRLGGDGVDETGVWCQWDTPNGARFWKIEITEEPNPHNCFEALEGACVGGAECKALICTAWPLHPDHVAAFDNCSYTFVKLNEWKIDEQPSRPHFPQGCGETKEDFEVNVCGTEHVLLENIREMLK